MLKEIPNVLSEKKAYLLTRKCMDDPDFNSKNYKWLISKQDTNSILFRDTSGYTSQIVFNDDTYVIYTTGDNRRVINYHIVYDEFVKLYQEVETNQPQIYPVSPELSCRRPTTKEELQNADIFVYDADTMLAERNETITVFELRRYYHTVDRQGNLYYVTGRKTVEQIRNMHPIEIYPYHGNVSANWTIRIELVTSRCRCNNNHESLDGYHSTCQIYKGVICRNGKDFYAFRSGNDMNICYQKAANYIKEFNDDYIWGSFNRPNWEEQMIGKHVRIKEYTEEDLVVDSIVKSQLCVILTLPNGLNPTWKDPYSGELMQESFKIRYNSPSLIWNPDMKIE